MLEYIYGIMLKLLQAFADPQVHMNLKSPNFNKSTVGKACILHPICCSALTNMDTSASPKQIPHDYAITLESVTAVKRQSPARTIPRGVLGISSPDLSYSSWIFLCVSPLCRPVRCTVGADSNER